MQKTETKIGIVILAGGNSRRLGKPKQSVLFKGETLLEKIVFESLQTPHRPIIVVLGSNAGEFETKLADKKVETVENRNWRQGMGTSISRGVKKGLEIEEKLAALVICVCDQPFVSRQTIEKLVGKFSEKSCRIVASAYGQTFGVPALFDKSLFKELAELDGENGAKKIIEKYRNETAFVEFPEGEIDIDTLEDVENLRKIEQKLG